MRECVAPDIRFKSMRLRYKLACTLLDWRTGWALAFSVWLRAADSYILPSAGMDAILFTPSAVPECDYSLLHIVVVNF